MTAVWFAVRVRGAGAEASEFVNRGDVVDVMLLDIRMPGKSGVDVVRDAVLPPRYPIVAMTGHVDADAQVEFRCEGWCTPPCGLLSCSVCQ